MRIRLESLNEDKNTVTINLQIRHPDVDVSNSIVHTGHPGVNITNLRIPVRLLTPVQLEKL